MAVANRRRAFASNVVKDSAIVATSERNSSTLMVLPRDRRRLFDARGAPSSAAVSVPEAVVLHGQTNAGRMTTNARLMRD